MIKRELLISLIFIIECIFMMPAHAYIIENEMMLLLIGPVSEAVQETILLIRRGENFVSADSLVIGCVAGASAGAMVSIAPSVGFMASGVAPPISISYMIGSSILSCAMSLVGSAVGMVTSSFLKQLRESSSKN
ncbi:membrane hypothetical protein [Gammaproteobacteria bacterium]